jgi:hypothetical protein
MERPIFEAEHQTAFRHTTFFHHLDQLTLANDLAGRGPNEKESVRQPFEKSYCDRTGLRFTKGDEKRRDEDEATKRGETASDPGSDPRV